MYCNQVFLFMSLCLHVCQLCLLLLVWSHIPKTTCPHFTKVKMHGWLVVGIVQDVRGVFEREARRTGKRRLLLTVAVATGSHFINVAYEPRQIIR